MLHSCCCWEICDATTKLLSKCDPEGSSNITAGLISVSLYKGYYIKKTEEHSWPDVCTSLCCSRTMKVMAAGQRHVLPLFINCSQEGRCNSHFFKYGNVLFLPISLWNENTVLPASLLSQLLINVTTQILVCHKWLSCSCSLGGRKEKEIHIWGLKAQKMSEVRWFILLSLSFCNPVSLSHYLSLIHTQIHVRTKVVLDNKLKMIGKQQTSRLLKPYYIYNTLHLLQQFRDHWSKWNPQNDPEMKENHEVENHVYSSVLKTACRDGWGFMQKLINLHQRWSDDFFFFTQTTLQPSVHNYLDTDTLTQQFPLFSVLFIQRDNDCVQKCCCLIFQAPEWIALTSIAYLWKQQKCICMIRYHSGWVRRVFF